MIPKPLGSSHPTSVFGWFSVCSAVTAHRGFVFLFDVAARAKRRLPLLAMVIAGLCLGLSPGARAANLLSTR